MTLNYFPNPLFSSHAYSYSSYFIRKYIYMVFLHLWPTLILALDMKLNIFNAHHQPIVWMNLNISYIPQKVNFCMRCKYTSRLIFLNEDAQVFQNHCFENSFLSDELFLQLYKNQLTIICSFTQDSLIDTSKLTQIPVLTNIA